MWQLTKLTNNYADDLMVGFVASSGDTFTPSAIAPLGSILISIPYIGIASFEDIGKKPLGPSTMTWGVHITLNNYEAVFRYESGGQLEVSVNADGSLSLNSPNGGQINQLSDSFELDNQIKNVINARNLPDLTIIASPEDVTTQTTTTQNISFIEALGLAISNWITDGSTIESPYALLKNDPGSFGLPNNPTDAQIRQKLQIYLNNSSSEVVLLHKPKPGETGPSRFPPENGESIEQFWQFRLILPEIGATLFWALVDRSGVKVPYNYGFS